MKTVKQTDVRHPYLRGRRKRFDDVMIEVESRKTARFLTWTALERMMVHLLGEGALERALERRQASLGHSNFEVFLRQPSEDIH